jgi:Mrp family chromosome partitioning ATPase
VEEFSWPRLCRRLVAQAPDELNRLADALLTLSAQGTKVLAIGGWHRSEGATTLLLCAARHLAERGVKTVLIDADLRRPRLAKRLGVQPRSGWDQFAADGQQAPLEQVLVEATANHLTLAPACEPSDDGEPPAVDRPRLTACIDILRRNFDVVLVDLGPLEHVGLWTGTPADGSFEGIDAVVLVRDERLTSPEQVSVIRDQLSASGAAVAGIIENFAAA